MARPVTGRTRAVVLFLDRCILWFSRHWCALANAFAGLYMGLPLLAPVLFTLHLAGPAGSIFLLYKNLCHQLPERSFFIFGQQMAYCERDTAIYTSAFVLGLIYAVTRGRWRPLPWWGFALLALPAFVDGSLQIVAPYESTWLARTVTGTLGALGAVWFLYPRFNVALARLGDAAALQLERAALKDGPAASFIRDRDSGESSTPGQAS